MCRRTGEDGLKGMVRGRLKRQIKGSKAGGGRIVHGVGILILRRNRDGDAKASRKRIRTGADSSASKIKQRRTKPQSGT